MFETAVREGVLRVRRPGTRWLSTGWRGGRSEGSVAYNVSVPEGWSHANVAEYVSDRLAAAGFEETGPTLLTGVDLDHCRGARSGAVTVYATAGLSNPAALPRDPPAGDSGGPAKRDDRRAGTVNLLVGTERALAPGARSELLAVAVEAKAATLLAETGFPGTTSDAVVVGCDPDGEPAEYAGSATTLGADARACVRGAVLASLRSRYPGRDYPESVTDAEHGTRTTRRAEVFRP